MKGFGAISITSIVVLIIAVAWLGYWLVYRNLLAKDLVFAYTALVAAMMMFALNVFFTLQPESDKKQVLGVMQHYKKIVVPYILEFNSGNRSHFTSMRRHAISEQYGIPTQSRDITSLYENKELEKKLTGILKTNILGVLLTEHPDWNPTGEAFVHGKISRFRSSKQEGSKDAFYTTNELITKLGLEVNEELFTTGIAQGLYLPAGTVVTSDEKTMNFENPHFSLSIKIIFSPNLIWDPIILPDGRIIVSDLDNHRDVPPQNLYYYRLDFELRYKRELSGSPEKELYRDWLNKIITLLEVNFKHIVLNT